MDHAEILHELAIIIEQIKKYVPKVAGYFDDIETVSQYASRLSAHEVDGVQRERQRLVAARVEAKIIGLWGDGALEKNKVDLNGPLAINIGDHHQVLNHPFLIASNVISGAGKILLPQKSTAIVVISSGDVPPNNFFSLNGFTFHGKRVSLFSASERETTSYYLPKRLFDPVDRLRKINRWTEFNESERAFLVSEQERLQSYDYSRCQNYIDQISIVVRESWPRMFEEKLRATLPELLYVTQEELVSDCLIQMLTSENFITATFFSKQFRQVVLDNFRGNVVAWRESEGKGTHFFWRKHPDRAHSLRMYVQGEYLVPHDERYHHLAVPLEPAVLAELLKAREIYPNLFTIFSVLNFYAGIKPLTGYGSRVYLELFKEAWIRCLGGSAYSDELPRVGLVDTSGLIAGLPLFYKREGPSVRLQYAYDIMYDGGVSEEYLKGAFALSVRDLFSIGAIDMYPYYSLKYIPASEKVVPKITFDDVANLILGSKKFL